MTSEQPGRPAKVKAELGVIPETALWTLYHRAVEARRPDALLTDPMAVDLVERIDFPFEERFGADGGVQAQLQALRVGCFDREVEDFLARCPRGTVVCLGEGLETQFWRVDNGRVQWLTVDLPESLALRHALLPHGPRQRTLAVDARDHAWIAEVHPADGVLVVAQGLFMYLRPPEVRDLIASCAEHFPGGGLVFDAVPRWFNRPGHPRRIHLSSGYRLPPMPWRMDAGERHKLATAHPGIAEIRDVPLPRGRGLVWSALAPLADRIPVVWDKRPSVTLLRFASR